MIGKLVLAWMGIAAVPQFRNDLVHDAAETETAVFGAHQRVARRSLETSAAIVEHDEDETRRIEHAQSDIRATLDILAQRLERPH